MTCLVAVACRGGSYLGVDSLVTDGGTFSRTNAKMRVCNGYIIAGAGDARILSAMHIAKLGAGKLTTMEEVYKKVLLPIRKMWGELAVDVPADQGAGIGDWELLIATAGPLLWQIDMSGCILPSTDYLAVGSGAPFALGALSALDEREHESIKVRKALSAACQESLTCSFPIQVERAKYRQIRKQEKEKK